jgi:beta-N-acetylhexosaminidase
MNISFKPVIVGLSGHSISKKEYFLFKKHSPIGYIIFSRNIKNFFQLKNLISELKSLNPYQKTLIMIDHEGGRVNRFSKFFDQSHQSAKIFGDYFKNDKKKFNQELNKFINFNSNLFNYLGINLIATPVLDLFYPNKSSVISDRAYSDKNTDIIDIGNTIVKKYLKKGLMTIGKHAPGHGLSMLDSHFHLPIINESKEFLYNNDFKCFNNLKSQFLMTAHILYKNIDHINPATFSSTIIKILKKKLKFKGLIMSDDICMKALNGSIESRAVKSFDAGCDIVLHCNGNFNEMTRLFGITSYADKKLLAKMIKIFNYSQ